MNEFKTWLKNNTSSEELLILSVEGPTDRTHFVSLNDTGQIYTMFQNDLWRIAKKCSLAVRLRERHGNAK